VKTTKKAARLSPAAKTAKPKSKQSRKKAAKSTTTSIALPTTTAISRFRGKNGE
jgi:hypothetical protein